MSIKFEIEAERLEKETGIDFKKYRNPEMVKKISHLIGFYRQTNTLMMRYIIILLVIVVALCIWFHTREMSGVGIALFLIVGTFFSVAEGICWGLMKLAKNAVKEGADIVLMMLDFLKEIKTDLSTLAKNNPDAKVTLSNLFRGISYEVFIPAVSQIIRDKLKFLAKPANFVIENTIFYLTKSLSTAMDKAESKSTRDKTAQAGSQEEQKDEKMDEVFNQLIDDAREKIGPMVDSVGRKVALPAKITFNVTLFIGVPILLIIYLVFK
ncbi:MAG: hypothetical protein JSV88_22300 [Candidatus Aminicenantes bacterium]|nr:MAG: hypothetical protein JSV88_22300 [Candidatus Aminicenantes bacterium]